MKPGPGYFNFVSDSEDKISGRYLRTGLRYFKFLVLNNMQFLVQISSSSSAAKEEKKEDTR